MNTRLQNPLIWKTVLVREPVSPRRLSALATSRKRTRNWAMGVSILNHPQVSVDLIIVTPADFGFTMMPRTKELFDSKLLAEWSTQNLKGYTLEFCSAETCRRLRKEYVDQPKDGYLTIPIERGTASERKLVGHHGRVCFTLIHRHGCKPTILPSISSRNIRWPLTIKLVFRLQKI